MKVFGIDPGLEHTGWGIVEAVGSDLKFIAAGVIDTNPKDTMAKRLVKIEDGMTAVLNLWQPDQVAIEETFVNTNAASSLKLGQARGVAILAPAKLGFEVHEYATNKIKKSVVGAGHADKNQIALMVKMLLPALAQNGGDLKADAFDALAVAICHAHHAQSAHMIRNNVR